MLERLISFIFSGISIKFLIHCFAAIGCGAFISYSLILSGQLWARTFSNIMTFSLLPVISLVITTVISGNIALSLGMVGALSIIRFRHPVKSPLELSIYFLLLTVGITIPSSLGRALVLSLISMTVIYSYAFYTRKKMSSTPGYLDLSFSREEPAFLLEVNCSKKNQYLSENKNMISGYEDFKNSVFTYKLSFFSKVELDKIKENITDKEEVIEIKYSVL